jgi:hypothetical protein
LPETRFSRQAAAPRLHRKRRKRALEEISKHLEVGFTRE